MCPPQKKKKELLFLLPKTDCTWHWSPILTMGLEVGEILKYVPSRSLKSFCWNHLYLLLHLWPSPPSCLFSPIFVPLGFVATLSLSISSQNTLLHPQVLSFLIVSFLCWLLPASPYLFCNSRCLSLLLPLPEKFTNYSLGTGNVHRLLPGKFSNPLMTRIPSEILLRFSPLENQPCIPWGCPSCCFCSMVLASHQCTFLEGGLTLSSTMLYLCLQEMGGNLHVYYTTYRAAGDKMEVSVLGHIVAQSYDLPIKTYHTHSTPLCQKSL